MSEQDTSSGGWFGYAPGRDNPRLTPEQREHIRQLEQQRGDLVATVHVLVYSSGQAHPSVSFPNDSPLSMRTFDDDDEQHRAQVAEVVRLARESLASWD
ncbi:MAG TPA: hypothetical protein VGA69_11995 [Nitriliruptorales bacterium]